MRCVKEGRPGRRAQYVTRRRWGCMCARPPRQSHSVPCHRLTGFSSPVPDVRWSLLLASLWLLCRTLALRLWCSQHRHSVASQDLSVLKSLLSKHVYKKCLVRTSDLKLIDRERRKIWIYDDIYSSGSVTNLFLLFSIKKEYLQKRYIKLISK